MVTITSLDRALGPRLLGPQTRLDGLAPNHILHGFAPVNEVHGSDAYCAHVLEPLRAAFPHGEERADIQMAGQYRGGDWVAFSGHIAGNFANDLFGIPATGRAAMARFGRFERHENGKIAETILILDLPALMMQAGCWPCGPAMGPGFPAPGPATHDGIVSPNEPSGDASLALVNAMIGGLHKFDGSLKSMGMRGFWTEDFWWFGPAPIGNFRGHADYERGHQLPFLTAFPDRVGGNHRARIGEGAYVASTGWPSITATHTGGGWLGLAPTGRKVTMRVMDFWRRENDRLAENWVMIDIPDLLGQMGIDVFERMRVLRQHTSIG
ncbi:MAG: ester cyclase [Parasphingorhabdus sp.]|nr:ester cyclase [Parasphingorhabdus sp.]